MASYPVEIRRCQHIKTSGAQCGSPAVKDKEFCYYHESNRTISAPLYIDGQEYADSLVKIPPLEDAHAIQMVLRHTMTLLMSRRIDRKDAGLMLYALQIASGNLKRMEEEKPAPTQVVREPEKVAETPMGMTPWSATGEGHDVELEEGQEEPEPPAPPMTGEELYHSMSSGERQEWIEKLRERDMVKSEDVHAYFDEGGEDPYLLATIRMRASAERRAKERKEAAQGLGGGEAGGETASSGAGA